MPPKSVDPLTALTGSRLAVVAGKGGVGKTTVTAALARAAVDAGMRVAVVELDGKPTLAGLLPDLEVRSLTAADGLAEYLDTHGLRRLARKLSGSKVIDVVSTAAPGIEDIVVLGKLKQLERNDDYDLVLVDGPAAGHAVSFLQAPASLVDAVSTGPIHEQATAALEMLHDGERSQVLLVTTAEATPVNETIETARALDERVGVRLGPLIVNALDRGPTLEDASVLEGLEAEDRRNLLDAARHRRERRHLQARELERLRHSLPLEQRRLPALPTASFGPAHVDELVHALRVGA